MSLQRKSEELAWKAALVMFLVSFVGDISYFLSNAVVGDQWVMRAPQLQLLLIMVLKDFSIILLGKLGRYYNAQQDVTAEELKTEQFSNSVAKKTVAQLTEEKKIVERRVSDLEAETLQLKTTVIGKGPIEKLP